MRTSKKNSSNLLPQMQPVQSPPKNKITSHLFSLWIQSSLKQNAGEKLKKQKLKIMDWRTGTANKNGREFMKREEKEKIIKNEEKKPDEQKRNEEVKKRIKAEDFTKKIARENFEEKKNPRIWK
jgi:hypothetical protein